MIKNGDMGCNYQLDIIGEFKQLEKSKMKKMKRNSLFIKRCSDRTTSFLVDINAFDYKGYRY